MRYQFRNFFSFSELDGSDLARGEIVSTSVVEDGQLSSVMQARCSLTQRCWAHAMHGIGIPRGHVDRFYGEIPEEDRDHQLMNYLSFWAFANRDLDYMELSYRYFLLEPVEFMVDFSRQRVKVMQAVIRRDLESDDLLRLFELMPHRMHADWFEKLILPVLEEQRMASAASLEMFQERKKALQTQAPQVPPRTQAPGRITLNF